MDIVNLVLSHPEAKILLVVALIDLLFGVLQALKAGRFNLEQFADFLKPLVEAYIALGIVILAATAYPELAPVVTVAIVAIAGKYLGSALKSACEMIGIPVPPFLSRLDAPIIGFVPASPSTPTS